MTGIGGSVRIVVRYRDGRLLKGTTQDFFPNKPVFHLQEEGKGASEVVNVEVSELKALFFVKTLEGERTHHIPKGLETAAGVGRRLRVIFTDGESLIGFTVGCNRLAPGFFITPADTEGNNERVFVVNMAVKAIEWL